MSTQEDLHAAGAAARHRQRCKELLEVLDCGEVRAWRGNRHAFAVVTYAFPGTCAACNERIWGPFSKVVRCLSCGMLAHRACIAPGASAKLGECCAAAAGPTQGALSTLKDKSESFEDIGADAPQEPPGEPLPPSKAFAIASSVGLGVTSAILGGAVAGPAGCYVGINLGQYATMGLAAAKLGMGAGGAAMGYHSGLRAAEEHRKRRLVLARERRWKDMAEVREALLRLGRLEEVEIPEIWREVARDFVCSAQQQSDSADAKHLTEFDDCTMEEEAQVLVARAFADEGSLVASLANHLFDLFRERHPGTKALTSAHLYSSSAAPERRPAPAAPFSAVKDVYGLAHEVLATVLLQVPGLRSCVDNVVAAIRCVDRHVFMHLYGAAFEELRRACEEDDAALDRRLEALRREREQQESAPSSPVLVASPPSPRGAEEGVIVARPPEEPWTSTGFSLDARRFLSTRAIKALRAMRSACTAHDKLRCAVAALEAAGEMEGGRSGEAAAMLTADELLPTVCAHLIEARVPHLHAQLAFVSAFGREETCYGREGYALVTLEAALKIVMRPEDGAHFAS